MKRILIFVLSAILLTGALLVPVRAMGAENSARAGQVVTTSGRLNVRSRGTTGAAVVSSLGRGSYVILSEKSGSWWRVEYAKGKFGYCHQDYIRVVDSRAATVVTQSGGLNIRSGPGTSHSKIGSLNRGEGVLVLSEAAGWSRILYHGTRTGYVSSAYLSAKYQAVSLNVPDFKQMDDRWAEVIIGQSGKTMAQIGCATTAIAMMESFRTGTVIDPRGMSQKLSYTPSGSVYWPSHYRVTTEAAGYLEAVYDLLSRGKPVLLGCRNSAGKQHWVVVTGFAGGGKLTASDFIIRDPGSNNRSNLQQFLDIYPHFYKFFHY